MTKFNEYSIRTSLSTKEIATTFRDYIQGRSPGFTGATWSRKLAWSFSTPAEENNPFAEIENKDRPAFRVSADHRLAKKPLFMTDAQVASWDGSITLEIYEEDTFRIARIHSWTGPGHKAQVKLVLDQITAVDSSAEVNARVINL